MSQCARCGGPQPASLVEVTNLADGQPRFVPGRPDPCRMCGWAGQPVSFTEAPAVGAVVFYPLPPTPAQLMRAAASLCSWLD